MSRAMKPSGIEWIGDIPEGWEVKRLRYFCKILTGNKDTVNREPRGLYPFYVRSPMVERINSYSYDGEAILMAGDGVGAGRVFHYVNGKFDYHQRVYNLHKFNKIAAKFLFYYLQENFKKEIDQSNAKSTVDSIRLPMLLNFPIAICDLQVQERIIDYLDEKCELIDSAIERQKTAIEKLKLYKQSVITEAVTKGLDPTLSMKPSGIEWIGDIPKEWEYCRLRYNTYLKGRIGWQGLKASEFIDEGPYLVTGTDFKDGNINWSTCYHISDERYEEAPEIHLALGDLLITKDGTVGKLAYISYLPDKTSLNSHLLLLRPKNSKFINKFLFWVLSSENFKIYIGLSQDGTIMESLSQEKISNFSFSLPPLPEQQAIADYLDKKCAQIDQTIELKEKLIEKLSDYKKSLIYECVTGKREVGAS